jgi:xanthine dehydrogenase YagS FAD-binding subunit
MRAFEYARAATIDEATAQHTQTHAGMATTVHSRTALPVVPPGAPENGTRFLAGGTDLLTLMKADIIAPSLLIDIKRVEDLPRGIEDRPKGGGLTLGALTTLSEIEHHPRIRERYAALAEAVSQAATPQLRNMATIGGNLLQRPRCWYYRNSLFPCWLKGGDTCHARDGENSHHAIFGGESGESPCVAVHPSDAASALLALNATVRLRGPNGERTLPVSELFAEPTEQRRTETTLQPGELLLDIQLPPPLERSRSVYLKAMDRKVWAFALVGVAAVVQVDGDRITSARIVLSGVAPIPWRAVDAEAALIGKPATTETFALAADAAVKGAHPLELNGYKVSLARSLVSRALTDATSGG